MEVKCVYISVFNFCYCLDNDITLVAGHQALEKCTKPCACVCVYDFLCFQIILYIQHWCLYVYHTLSPTKSIYLFILPVCIFFFGFCFWFFNNIPFHIGIKWRAIFLKMVNIFIFVSYLFSVVIKSTKCKSHNHYIQNKTKSMYLDQCSCVSI